MSDSESRVMKQDLVETISQLLLNYALLKELIPTKKVGKSRLRPHTIALKAN
jgi:hypothetical protein